MCVYLVCVHVCVCACVHLCVEYGIQRKLFYFVTILLSPFTVILSWFVEKPIVQATLKGALVEEESVDCRPKRVSNAVLDENVDIHLTCSYFSQDAWMIVEGVVQKK